jgi:predicted nucleic-acid-binding Zn-ribbon protein
MALCPKCGNHSFTASIESVQNLNVKIIFITCQSCDTVIGTVDAATSDRIKKIEEKLDKIVH